MGKFVVIDKEKVERSEHSELIKTAISLLIKHCVATELSTDESIEERAEKKYPDAIVTINLAKKMRYIEGATEQSLIEQMKAKEFAVYISERGWFYHGVGKWRRHNKSGFDYKTTEELFNQFTNK